MKKIKLSGILSVVLLCISLISCDNSGKAPSEPSQLAELTEEDIATISKFFPNAPAEETQYDYLYTSTTVSSYLINDLKLGASTVSGKLQIKKETDDISDNITLNGEVGNYKFTDFNVVYNYTTIDTTVSISGKVEQDGKEITDEEPRKSIIDAIINQKSLPEVFALEETSGEEGIEMHVENGLLINSNNGSSFNATGEYRKKTVISGTTGNHTAAWLISFTDSQGTTSKFSVGFTATQSNMPTYDFSNIDFEYLSINGKYFRTSTLSDATKMDLLRLFYL